MKTMVLPAAALIGIWAWAPAMAQMGQSQEPLTHDQYIAQQKATFAAMDTNGDGVVTKEELAAEISKRMGGNPAPPQMVDHLFAMMDGDGDGKATAAETAAASEAHFAAMDANKDGTVTPEERRAAMMRMMHQP